MEAIKSACGKFVNVSLSRLSTLDLKGKTMKAGMHACIFSLLILPILFLTSFYLLSRLYDLSKQLG